MAQFTGRVEAQIVSGGKGHSAVSKAAYNARCVLENTRLGTRDNYSTKAAECLFSGVYAPKDAPEWTRDRGQLWNHVEAFELGKRKDAQLAREFQIALPHELTPEQGRYALQDFIRDNFTRKGLVADLAIHGPDRHGDQRNLHAHLMVVLRKLDGTEFAAKKDRLTQQERAAELDGWKRSLEHHLNRHLERHGFQPYYDLRSLAERGIDAEPTIHMGKDAAALEREGVETEPGRINRNIEERNRLREELARLLAEQAREAANQNDGPPLPARAVALAERQPDPTQDLAPEIRAADPAPEKRHAPELVWRVAAAPIRLEPRQEAHRGPSADLGHEYLPQWPHVLRPSEKDHPGLFSRVWSVVREWLHLPKPKPKRHPLHLEPEPARPTNRLQLEPEPPRPVDQARLPASRPKEPERDRAPDRPRSIADELLEQARAAREAKRSQETPEQRHARQMRERESRGDGGRDRHYRKPAWPHLDHLGRPHGRRWNRGWRL